ncbi:MAG: hypothetical protein ISQ06_13170 [Planctomycetaceae bacterium]|jgi:hypothetical protein|nr:hypothetical protein [Planctomycetaceae bacterium]
MLSAPAEKGDVAMPWHGRIRIARAARAIFSTLAGQLSTYPAPFQIDCAEL